MFRQAGGGILTAVPPSDGRRKKASYRLFSLLSGALSVRVKTCTCLFQRPLELASVHHLKLLRLGGPQSLTRTGCVWSPVTPPGKKRLMDGNINGWMDVKHQHICLLCHLRIKLSTTIHLFGIHLFLHGLNYLHVANCFVLFLFFHFLNPVANEGQVDVWLQESVLFSFFLLSGTAQLEKTF